MGWKPACFSGWVVHLDGNIQSQSFLSGTFSEGFNFNGKYLSFLTNIDEEYDGTFNGDDDIEISEDSKIDGIFSGSITGIYTGSMLFTGSIDYKTNITGTFAAASYFRGEISEQNVFVGDITIYDITSSNALEVHSHNCPRLTEITLDNSYQLKMLDFVDCQNFVSLSVQRCNSINKITLLNNPNLAHLNFNYTYLPTDVLDSFLPQLYSQSLDNSVEGYLEISGTNIGDLTGKSQLPTTLKGRGLPDKIPV